MMKQSGLDMDKGYTNVVVNVMFAQMKVDDKYIDTSTIHEQISFNKGQKLFGERVVSAIIKEYNQMDDMRVLDMIDSDTLNSNQKRTALRAVNLTKKKRNGSVKGIMCANRAPHRKFVPRKEVISPTISL